MSDVTLDRCGCFEETAAAGELWNRPGLPEIAYRIGTHSAFLRRMLRGFPSQEVGTARPLGALTTRSTDDAGVALADAWALVADVLTFYQERIANEGFLRTATERRSVLELARMIGYELDPGVAASTYLAFTVEDAAGAPESAVVAEGIKVQSIPSQGQRPQTFETVEEIEARAGWNVLRPRLTQPQALDRGADHVYLAGTSTQLVPGDLILLVGNARMTKPGSERWDVRTVETVEPDPDNDRTLVTWALGLGHDGPTIDPEDDPRVYAFRSRTSLFGYNAPDFRAMPLSVKQAYDTDYPDREGLVRGHSEWPGFDLPSGKNPVIHLDGVHPKVMAGTWIVFTRPGYTELYGVTESSPSAQSDFTMSAKTTRLELDAYEHLSWFNRRQTLVYIESEELPLGEEPIETEVSGDSIELGTTVGELRREHTILVSGRLVGASEDDPPEVEAAIVTTVEESGGRATLRLAASLVNAYQRDTVVVFANVARATHGETVLEVLGSGDGARRNQSFTLKKPPLTYVSAATPSGSRSELEVRVDGVLWDELPSLYGLDPSTQAYVVRIDDDSKATVTFGDGSSGARLPTGVENVTSAYRSGIGPDGAVDTGSLSLLQTRPYGIKSVTNPVRASGAAAAETLEEARTNAPLTVLTLDRIVSLRDFEDFARSFAGIGKAQAVTLWDRKTRFVHLTVAAADGTALDPGGTLEVNLLAGIDAARDAVAGVAVDSFQLVTFDTRARILVDARYETDVVEEAVRAAIEDRFSFERRSFGQPVTRAEVIATMQGVEGVVAAMVDELHPTDDTSDLLVERIPAETAAVLDPVSSRAPRVTVGAQLLLVNAAGVTLETTRP